MSPVLTGIIGIVVLFVLLGIGMPVGWGMLIIGAAGFTYLTSLDAVINILGTVTFNLITSYDYCVLPLFIFMAAVCLESGLAANLFGLVNAWLARLRGGMAIASVGACAMFSAASASSIATAITIGAVAFPEMEKQKYDRGLATGVLAAGGTLGILIPPSGLLIIYGIITEQSIGELFRAGIIPGLCLTLLMMLTVFLRVWRKPALAPTAPSIPFREKLRVSRRSVDMVLLLVVVIVGIIVGWFTPTEAGAVGAFGAVVLSLLRRRLSWSGFKRAFIDTMKNTGLLFTIIVGAYVLNSFLAVTTIPMELADWVESLGFPAMVVMIIIIAMYFILGCFIDATSMVLLTVPIFFPLVVSLGFDPIWFGIFIVLMVELAAITPPLGLNVYVIAGIAKTPMHVVFKGVLPFVVTELVMIALLLAFPRIALFLPALMH